MKQLKIKLHSVVDLITNSSTVIFTYSSGCDNALRNLFKELKETFNIKESIDDIFYISTLCDSDVYYNYIEKLDIEELDDPSYEISEKLTTALKDEETDYKILDKLVNEVIGDVQYNRTGKPKWMHLAEKKEDSWTYYTPDTYISLIPKEKKYENIAKLFYNLIYSTDHEAAQDG